MFQKILVAAAVVMACGAAQAAEGSSEFFFQSAAGQSELTPRLGYKMSTIRSKGNTQDIKVNGLFNTGVAYEYGINEMMAVEAALNFASLETDTNPKVKQSGLQDPTVKLKATSAMGTWNLRYGAELGLGLEKSKIEASGNTNAASGGFSLTPYVGADANVGPGNLGGRLMYAYKMDRKEEDNGVEDTIKDGNEIGLSAFYEYMITDMLLGGSLNYRDIAESKNNSGVAEVKHSIMGVSLYSRIPMGTWALLPRLDYDFSSTGDLYEKYNDINLSVAARFTF